MKEVLLFLSGVGSSLLASLVFYALSGWLERQRRFLKMKIGSVSIELDMSDPGGAAQELAAHVGEPRVFISHSSRDKDFASRLAHDLEQEGLRVWLPSDQIQPGESLKGRIAEGLRSSGYMLPIISQNSLTSDSVQREIELATERENAGKWPKVIPVRIDESHVPGILADRVWLDMASDYETALTTLIDLLTGRQEQGAE